MEDNGQDLHRKYRPTKLSQVVGQPVAVKTLEGFLREKRVPHAILFAGNTGCGKTTFARILAREMGCAEIDLEDIDCASCDPIATARDLRSRAGLSPMGGPVRVWVLEEVQSLSRARFAQQALLKFVEEPPAHAYLFLTTTEPEKIIQALRNRCVKVPVKAVGDDDLGTLLDRVSKKEGAVLSNELRSALIDAAAGCVREALVGLQQALAHVGDEDRIASIIPEGVKKDAFEIVRALLWQKPDWGKVAAILKEVKEDPEMLRRLILANARNEILKGRNPGHANLILVAFENPFGTGACGPASLARACYEVIESRAKGR